MATQNLSNYTAYKTYKSRTQFSNIPNSGNVTIARAGYFGSIVNGIKLNYNNEDCELNLYIKGTASNNLWGILGKITDNNPSGSDIITYYYEYTNASITAFGLIDWFPNRNFGIVKTKNTSTGGSSTTTSITINGAPYTSSYTLNTGGSLYPETGDIINITTNISAGVFSTDFLDVLTQIPHIKTKVGANGQPIIQLENNGTIVSNATLPAASNTFTSNGHGLVDLQEIVFSKIVGDSIFKTNTIYYVRNITANTFQLSATIAGAIISGVNAITESSLQVYEPEEIVINKRSGTISTNVFCRVDLEDF